MKWNELPDIPSQQAWDVIGRVLGETTKWLLGLDEPARILIQGLFTVIPYTDKLGRIKSLGQPHGMFIGGTGVGKTDLVESMSMTVKARFQRIQGNPELLPSDIVISEAFDYESGNPVIVAVPGPIFAHVLLFDEGNRAPGVTKSAILEAAEERSVTLPRIYPGLAKRKIIPVYPLSEDLDDIDGLRFSMMLVTQNIFGEEEGTYANPVAELDRITFTIPLRDPDNEEDEMAINAENVVGKTVQEVTDLVEVLTVAKHIYSSVGFSPQAKIYRARLLRNTRPHRVQGLIAGDVKKYVHTGASPRVNFHLEAMARSAAFFDGSEVVTPDHVKSAARLVIPHRLVLRPGVQRKISKQEFFEKVIEATDLPK